MSKWVKCLDDLTWGELEVIKKGEVYEAVNESHDQYELTNGDWTYWYNKIRFTPCDPPEKIKIEKMEFSDLSCHEIDTPIPLKPSDPVPEYCYHVTNKAIKHNKCSFVKSRNFDGKDEEYILLDHGGKREFGDTYASLEDAETIAKQLWGIK